MATGSKTRGGVFHAISVDLRRLHETWMELVFPRQRTSTHSVLGKWTPNTTTGWIGYRLWAALGVLIVALLYPLALFGFMARFYARKADGTATRIGILGVVAVSVLIWGALTVFAHFRFSRTGFLAVGAAGVVATISAALAVVFSRIGGRKTTVFLGYPFGMTAVFLPPVVAALYSPTLAQTIFPQSESLAIWLLDNVLYVGGINEFLRSRYSLSGLGYVGMWFGIAVPLGWILGGLVTLADLIRPK
ncbi:hypothetical protein [Halostella pelagica]|uniref:hypothetical protein n=1 Tax=Halostella pelagica TaxID=2583824 RepID=UPI0010800858|nr:hypothetical protein [Halostella pelagica]